MGAAGRSRFILEMPHRDGNLGLGDPAARAGKFRVAVAADDAAPINRTRALR